MPILPLVDLLILMGTGSLLIGFLLKAISITTLFNPTLLGFSSVDFVLIAGVCMGFALTLVARTWLKLNEISVRAARGQVERAQAQERAALLEDERRAHEPQLEALDLASDRVASGK